MGHFLVAIVLNRERKFVGVVVSEDVRLFLVEKLDTLLSVAQEDILGVDDYFVAGIFRVDAHVTLESPVL